MGMAEDLYLKYGGFTTIKTLVSSFYDKVLKSDTLAMYFKYTDMSSQIHHQTMFLTMVLGGPNDYKGKSLEDAHKHLMLGETQFNEIVNLLKKTLEEHSVDPEDIETIINKIRDLKDQVLS